MKLEFSRQILKNHPVSNLLKILQLEPIYSMRTDGGTDMTNLIIVFRNFTSAQKYFRQNLQRKSKHFVFINSPPPLEKRAFYEIKCKNIVERGRPKMTIWRMRISSMVATSTDTDSEYIIFIASSQQKRLHEHASHLRYTYIACLVYVTLL
jgi:hypothetical protein